MTEREKMTAGLDYDAQNAELVAARLRAQDLCHALGQARPSDAAAQARILAELLPHAGPGLCVTPPFFCDYGRNIHIGANFYCNTGCVILDGAPVRIGEHVLLGPGVQIYTARHPLDPALRATGIESAAPVTIGDHVWIGGAAVILPGVTIGAGAVIGAGSVVTRDIPPMVVAAGNPCRVIRRVDGAESGSRTEQAGHVGEMERQFNLVAAEYDQNRRRFIPCFDEFYDGATAFLAANIAAPKRILDLGAGTGLLSACWLRHFPDAEYVLVDIAEDMLRLARKRFAGKANVSCVALDYAEALPDGAFDAALSALSIHHLEDADKERLFARIHAKLPEGGLFVNYDQFRAGQPEMDRWFDAFWHGQLLDGGLTEHDLALWRERRKLDRECSVAAETAMLRAAGFRIAQCVYDCRKFAVLAAIK